MYVSEIQSKCFSRYGYINVNIDRCDRT